MMQKQELFKQLKATFLRDRQNYVITKETNFEDSFWYHVMLNKQIEDGYRPEIFTIAHYEPEDLFKIHTITPINMDYYAMTETDLSDVFSCIKQETISFENVPINDLALFFYDDFLPWFEISYILRKITWYMDQRKHFSYYEVDIEKKEHESYEIGKACLLSKDDKNNYKLSIQETSTHPKLILTEHEAPKSCLEELHKFTTQTYNDIHKMTIRPSSATAKIMDLKSLLNDPCDRYHQSIVKKLKIHKKIFEQNLVNQYT